MEKYWQLRVLDITTDSILLLEEKKITKWIKKIDYVAIFPKSKIEYIEFIKKLQAEGHPVKTTPTGTVFRLETPIETSLGQILFIRVRIYQSNITQSGYVDYQIEDYRVFKEKCLRTNSVAITNNSDGIEMLVTKNAKVIIYFPEICLGENLKI